MGESKPTVCKYVTEKVRNTQISEQRLPGYNGRHTRLERDCDPMNGNLFSVFGHTVFSRLRALPFVQRTRMCSEESALRLADRNPAIMGAEGGPGCAGTGHSVA